MVRNRIPLALGAALVGCCLLAGSPPTATKKPPAAKKKTAARKKTKRRPAAPPVSPAARSAAERKVEAYLEGSAPKPFRQSGALVPFFEQLARLSTAENQTPVHII